MGCSSLGCFFGLFPALKAGNMLPSLLLCHLASLCSAPLPNVHQPIRACEHSKQCHCQHHLQPKKNYSLISPTTKGLKRKLDYTDVCVGVCVKPFGRGENHTLSKNTLFKMGWKGVAKKGVYGHTMINPPTAVRFSWTKFSSEQDVRCEHAAQ
jgi:hypothetical protein